ncbi:MAG TPA: LLM class flavin-dependent oxidoreductase [Nitrososphaerales archaeon]|nr:LLM class flavin-dependent oxidoreductase [Nitrososphaerales archaeon]
MSGNKKKITFGIVLPTRGVLFSGSDPRKDVIELSKMTEEFGYDGVWAGDSILAKPRLDSISVLSAVAGATERLKLGTSCFASFPLRHPILLGYQWATLDQLSGGRTILVICQGTPTQHGPIYRNEYDAFGISPKEKVERVEEGIEIMRKIWTEDDVSYNGKIYKFKNVTVQPKPVQKDCPIWIASNPRSTGELEGPPGNIEANLERVGKYADGWMTTMVTPDEYREDLDKVLMYVGKHGRIPRSDFKASLYYNVNMDEDKKRAADESADFLQKYYREDPSGILDMWVAFGNRAEVMKKLEAFVEAGVQDFNIRFVAWDQIGQLKKFSKEILPSFS